MAKVSSQPRLFIKTDIWSYSGGISTLFKTWKWFILLWQLLLSSCCHNDIICICLLLYYIFVLHIIYLYYPFRRVGFLNINHGMYMRVHTWAFNHLVEAFQYPGEIILYICTLPADGSSVAWALYGLLLLSISPAWLCSSTRHRSTRSGNGPHFCWHRPCCLVPRHVPSKLSRDTPADLAQHVKLSRDTPHTLRRTSWDSNKSVLGRKWWQDHWDETGKTGEDRGEHVIFKWVLPIMNLHHKDIITEGCLFLWF